MSDQETDKFWNEKWFEIAEEGAKWIAVSNFAYRGTGGNYIVGRSDDGREIIKTREQYWDELDKMQQRQFLRYAAACLDSMTKYPLQEIFNTVTAKYLDEK